MQLIIVLVAVVAATQAAPSVVPGMTPSVMPPCGVPPFVEMLPADAKDTINEIWKDYKEGEDCADEHEMTKFILDSLPPAPAGPPPPPCGVPTMIEVLPEETKLGLKTIWEGYVDGEDCAGRQEATQVFLDHMNREVMKKYNIPMPTPPCHLPPFAAKLPIDAKEEVEKIWAEYEEGNECYEQHEKTKAIIDTLPEDVKMSILPPGPPPPMLPPTNPEEPIPAGPMPPPPPVGEKPEGPVPNFPPPPPNDVKPAGPPPTSDVKPAGPPPPPPTGAKPSGPLPNIPPPPPKGAKPVGPPQLQKNAPPPPRRF